MNGRVKSARPEAGKPRSGHKGLNPRLARDEAAVTPVIGTIFILAITVVGMATVLMLGAPVLAGLQDQAALRTVVNQLGQVRHDVSSLTIEGASKAPGLTLPSGSIGIESGDSFVIAVNQDDDLGNTACDMHLLGLENANPSTDNQIGVSLLLCKLPLVSGTNNCGITSSNAVVVSLPPALNACFETFRIDPATGMPVPVGNDFNSGTGCPVGSPPPCFPVTLFLPLSGYDWVFQLTNGASGTARVVHSEAYFLHTQQLHWSTASAAGGADALFEAGAIFATSKGGQYLEANPPIREAATGDLSGAGAVDQFYWRFPAIRGNPSGAFSGQDSHSVLLTLDDTALRTQTTTATSLRIDVAGPMATAWCNSLLLRNGLQSLPKDSTGARTFQYAEDTPGFPCATGDLVNHVRSVTYKTSLNDPFAFQLVHARFLASFQA